MKYTQKKLMYNRSTKPKLSILNTGDDNELDDDFDIDNLTENVSFSSANQHSSILNPVVTSKSINKNNGSGFKFNLNEQNFEKNLDNLDEEDPLDNVFEYENDDNELYLSILYQNSKIACCYYDLNKKYCSL